MKSIIKPSLAIILSLAISCKKESIKNSLPMTSQSANNLVAAHYIGERYGGGIIFYIDTTGQHGLIADTVDLPSATWWNGKYTLTGATKTGIRGGKSNTRKIILSQGDSGTYAARECKRSTRSGYKDWFLPTKSELYVLYQQKDVVGDFGDVPYWSSTESSDSNWSSKRNAWVRFFNVGTQSHYDKSYTGYVRAVRAF